MAPDSMHPYRGKHPMTEADCEVSPSKRRDMHTEKLRPSGDTQAQSDDGEGEKEQRLQRSFMYGADDEDDDDNEPILPDERPLEGSKTHDADDDEPVIMDERPTKKDSNNMSRNIFERQINADADELIAPHERAARSNAIDHALELDKGTEPISTDEYAPELIFLDAGNGSNGDNGGLDRGEVAFAGEMGAGGREMIGPGQLLGPSDGDFTPFNGSFDFGTYSDHGGLDRGDVAFAGEMGAGGREMIGFGGLPGRGDGNSTPSGYQNPSLPAPFTSPFITASNGQTQPQHHPRSDSVAFTSPFITGINEQTQTQQPSGNDIMARKSQKTRLRRLRFDIVELARKEQVSGVDPFSEEFLTRLRSLGHLEMGEDMMEALHMLFNPPERLELLQEHLSKKNYIQFRMYLGNFKDEASLPQVQESIQQLSLNMDHGTSTGSPGIDATHTGNKSRGRMQFPEKIFISPESDYWRTGKLNSKELEQTAMVSFTSEDPAVFEGVGLLDYGSKIEDNNSEEEEVFQGPRLYMDDFSPLSPFGYIQGSSMGGGAALASASESIISPSTAENKKTKSIDCDKAKKLPAPKFEKFMQLPPELRARIFEDALFTGQGIRPHLCDSNTGGEIKFHADSMPNHGGITDLLGVTRVSKAIRAESLPCFYSANTFIVGHDTATYFTRLEHLGRFHMIRHVCFGIRLLFEKWAPVKLQHLNKHLRDVDEYEAAHPYSSAPTTSLRHWYKKHPNHVAGGLDGLSQLICLLKLTSRFTSTSTTSTSDYAAELVLPVPSARIFEHYPTLRWFPTVCHGLGIHLHLVEGYELSYSNNFAIGITWHQHYQKKNFAQQVGKVDVKGRILELFPEVGGDAETGGSMLYLRESCDGNSYEWFKVMH